MLKESISVFLAAVMGIIPIDNSKNASFDKNFTLSVPHFSQSDSGETEIVPSISPLKSQVNLYGSADNLPESFDLRESGKVSEVRNQTGYGTCWAHSAIASAESSIIKSKPEINLSEFHTAYYTYSGGNQIEPVSDNINGIMNRGGTIYTVTNLWSQWIGPVFEKRLKYGNTDFFKNESDVVDMKYTADYHLKSAYTFDFASDRGNSAEINNLIKQFVYSGRIVDTSFYSDNGECYNTKYFSTNSNKKPKFANHSVVIVGWDDNFSSDNFRIKPENNGAWLVRNSWGEDFGEDGYMWISYEDKSLCEFAVYEIEDAENYLYNFHHDTFVALQSLSASDDAETNKGSYMANVFSNYSDNIQIEAISTYINVPDTEYEITVYTNLTDKSDVTSGTPSAVTRGTQELTGYFNIPLDDYVIVESDTDFSVVVKLYSEHSPYVIPIETSLFVTDDNTGEIASLGSFTTYEGIKSYTGENESFYSTDGKEWADIFNEEYTYTDEEEEMILAELEEDLYDGIEPDDTEGLENAAAAVELYREIFASGTTSVIMGNISLKALGNPVGAVDFSHDSGLVPDGTKIELSAKNGADIYYCINDSELMPYTEPIEINEMTKICAGWISDDYATFLSERTYIPESKFKGYGDVDGNGLINADDASRVLEYYSESSVGGLGIYGFMADYADFNQDCKIDSADASEILALYAELSTK